MDFLEELKWRGLIKDISSWEKLESMNPKETGVYCGFDPTGSSLHVGHLILITLLERFRRAHFRSIALIGGGTAMIGDPSFRNRERILLDQKEVNSNARLITKQLKSIIPEVLVENNKGWLGYLKLVDYLRGPAKSFNVPYLISKEAITKRLAIGLSVTEFLYPTLQAYDFKWLYENRDCFIQIGGSDQWGNITSGLDLIRSEYKQESRAVGLTVPLLLQKSGEKFGKTARGNIVWLDSKKTSPYLFYQFWLLQTDDEALKLIKYLTFLDEGQIKKLNSRHKRNPKRKTLQFRLAREMTKFVHGKEAYNEVKELSELLFNNSIDTSNKDVRKKLFNSLPHATIDRRWSMLMALRRSGVTSSMRETLEFIEDGSITINNKTLSNIKQSISEFKEPRTNLLLVKKGKRNYFIWELH